MTDSSQPPKFGFARQIWLTCPECGGSLDQDRDRLVCQKCHYTKGNDR